MGTGMHMDRCTQRQVFRGLCEARLWWPNLGLGAPQTCCNCHVKFMLAVSELARHEQKVHPTEDQAGQVQSMSQRIYISVNAKSLQI